MDVGYFAMPLHPPGSDYTTAIHGDIEQMVVLDALGFREAWIGEHFCLEWENIPCPELFIAMALAKTKNIVLGTGVSNMPNHHPFHLAHRIAQLDHLARGRFQWGVGAGASPLDFEAFGVDYLSGAHRMLIEENVDLVLKIWEGPPPGVLESSAWRIKIGEPMPDIAARVHLKPYQRPHPPIAVASLSERSETLVMAGRRGWMLLSIQYLQRRGLLQHWQSYTQGAQQAGRHPNRSLWRVAREVFVADTSAEARRAALGGTLARDYRDYNIPILTKFGFLSILKPDLAMPDAEITPELLAETSWIVGDPAEVAQKIRALYQDLGGFGVLLALAHEWEPREEWLRSMTLLAKEVMPRLADLN